MVNSSKRNGHGGGRARGGIRYPKEAVRGKDENAGLEVGEVGVFFRMKVDGGHDGAFDFSGEENWAPACGELGHREPFSGHGSPGKLTEKID